MSDFNKPRFPRKSFGGPKPFGNRGGFDQGPREMFTATCAKCGKTCEVPFRPNGAKPVYCNDCFVREDSAPRGDFGARPPRRDFAPRPSYNNAAPAGQAPRNDQAFNDLKAELRTINANIERLVSIMSSTKGSHGHTASAAPSAPAAPKAEKAEAPAPAPKAEKAEKPAKAAKASKKKA